MKKIVLLATTTLLLVLGFFITAQPAQAQTMLGGCTSVGQCINNKRCVADSNGIVYPNGADCGSAQLGEVQLPESIRRYNILGSMRSGEARGTGLMIFISSLINLFIIICGIWTLFNFLYAGFIMISSQSDAKAMSTVRESLTMTAIGLAIIAGSYILAGLIGLIFFGDASFILDPKITGALDL